MIVYLYIYEAYTCIKIIIDVDSRYGIIYLFIWNYGYEIIDLELYRYRLGKPW